MKKMIAFVIVLVLCLSLAPMAFAADDTYQVRGTFNNWGSDHDMSDRGDGVYTLSLPLSAGEYEYKIALNKGWDTSYPSGNVWFKLTEAATVVFVFDPNTLYVGHYVEGAKYYLLGNMNNWGVSGAGELAKDGNLYVWTGTLDAGNCEFKIADTTDWSGSWWPYSSNYVHYVPATAEYTISFDPALKTITVNGDSGSTDPVYFVAGNTDLCGSDWSAADENNKMTKQNDGTYVITYTNLQPQKEYKFKITDGTWSNSWPTDDVSFAVKEAGSVTITFDPTDHSVKLSDNAIDYVPSLDGDEVLLVAGSAGLCGSEWSETDENNKMTKNNGVYTITYEDVPAGAYEFKVVKFNDWTMAWPTGNYHLVVADTADVTITFNPTDYSISVQQVVGGVVVPDKYVVAGNEELCGSYWDGSDEDNLMTEVSEGVYSITYEGVAAGYYELKVVKNSTEWIGGSDGNNVGITVSEDCDVTVTYSASGIEVTGDYVTVHVPGSPTTGDTTSLISVFAVMVLSGALLVTTVSSKKRFF